MGAVQLSVRSCGLAALHHKWSQTPLRYCHVARSRLLTPSAAVRLQVYKGLRRGVHEVAVKQLGNLKDPQLIRQFRKEIAILGRVSFQPNIVNFYGACLRNPANIMLVMELMEGEWSSCQSPQKRWALTFSAPRTKWSAAIEVQQILHLDGPDSRVGTACLCGAPRVLTACYFLSGGDLRHALSADETGEYSWWGKGRALALDIAHGLHFLHSSGVTHR